ncbi:MAG TPA: rod shape-determining protein MreC [Clostridiales bacterium]|nr:rod shape-determining protein MreC [Clostridiales bacterium]
MNSFGRYRRFAAAVVTLVVLVVLMGVTARERETVMLLERALVEAAAPIQAWFEGLAAGIRGGLSDIRAISQLRRENESLRAKAEAYDAALHRLRELEIENERLRALLGFSEAVPFDYVVADVIARNPDNWFSRVTIDRGARHGIAKDMPVVTSQGLVGRVVAVSTNVSFVQLLTDRECGVGALVQSSRDAGIVKGQGSQSSLLRMMFFEREAEVGEGDALVTSGLGEVYPPGLFIGRVVKITTEQHGLIKYAAVRPGVDFGSLEEVLVIVNYRAAGEEGEP